jgi:4-methyl-5(b-hydroxyethyl)-thiazole monophosphate biosynthesis
MSSTSRPRVLVPLAEGFEEIEAVTIIDVLRRAGCEVLTAGLAPGIVRGAHGVGIEADVPLAAVASAGFDLIVCPGGMPGTRRLMAHEPLLAMLRAAIAGERRVAAICAAPLVLNAAGLLEQRRWTSHPAVRAEIGVGACDPKAPLVRAGLVTTSQGVGTALRFALDLAAQLCGEAKAGELARAMLVPLEPRTA